MVMKMLVKALAVGTMLIGGASAAPASDLVERQDRPVPLGTAMFSCVKPNVVALTFDDGPYQYTDQALDILAQYNAKATFFLNGENWGTLKGYANTLRRMVRENHHVGSHTWNHPHLPELTNDQVKWQMTRFETEMRSIVNRYPTYMRPPYFEYNSNTLKALGEIGYRVVIADIDTNDWKGDMTEAFNSFKRGLDNGGSIVLAHDVHEGTVKTLLPRMLQELRRRNIKAVTVAECLGEPFAKTYRVRDRLPGQP